ncbi:hypothetical protein U6G28_01950 [Actinomycetaceae bacterium MB13-C1-2]|nr:hypothetical protein U6G28_01950 [Actinomycetaceae bacterium MB13-C1-2]
MRTRTAVLALVVTMSFGLAGCSSNGLSAPEMEQSIPSIEVVPAPQSGEPQSEEPQSEGLENPQSDAPGMTPANTIEQSCQIIFDAEQGGAPSLPAGDSNTPEEMQQYADGTRAAADRIDAAIPQVGDPDVQAAAGAMRDALVRMADAIQQVYVEQNGDASGDLTAAGEDYSSAIQQLYSICMPGSVE